MPNHALDLQNKTFGKWTVLYRESIRGGSIYWSCICECGDIRSIRGSSLHKGTSLSCGCLAAELSSIRQKARSIGNPARKHGNLSYFKSNCWGNIQQRTVNGTRPHPRNISYFKKGIELRMSKDEFYKFCDDNAAIIMSLYETKQCPTIDRIDNLGHYELGNLQILTKSENNKKVATDRRRHEHN